MKVKKLLILLVVILYIVVHGSTNVVVNENITDGQKKIDTKETFLVRLRRLDFNASTENNETIRLSISGGDVPVYVNAKAQREVSGDVYYTAFKIYGKRYIPKTKESLELLHTKDSQEHGWQLLPVGDGQCVVMYLQKIKNDVSDSKLVEALLSVQRVKQDQFPIRVDDRYPKLWSAYALGIIIYNQECEDEKASKNEDSMSNYCKHSPFNQTNSNKTIDMINDWDNMCPEDFKQAAIDYVNAQARLVRWMQNLANRKPDNSIDEAASVGAALGSLNEDNPQGGALLGALFGGIIGAAYQEDQRKELYAERDSLSSDVKEKRRKFGDYLIKIINEMKSDSDLNTPPICDINDK